MKVKSESEVAQSCPTLSDPMDCSPPGSSIHGIFQAGVLEWGAIAFSSYYMAKDRFMARWEQNEISKVQKKKIACVGRWLLDTNNFLYLGLWDFPPSFLY